MGSNFSQWDLSRILLARPAVRVNQRGYLPSRPARATWVTERAEPAQFVVRDDCGDIMAGGRSQPWHARPEATSGLNVHVLELDSLPARSGFCTIEVGGDHSRPFRVHAELYVDVAAAAVAVFADLHAIDDHAVPGWSGPRARALYPDWHTSGTFNASGGWYDAGDYGKYVVSGAIAVWQLLACADVVPATLRRVVLAECRWQLDWLQRMQVPLGQQYAGMAFHRVHGTTWSPMPGRPQDDPTHRVLHRPSTAATAQLAAVAAAGARTFAAADPAFASRLLATARTAFEAAAKGPVLLAPDDHGAHGGGPYADVDTSDDLFWAASELWLTTGDSSFLNSGTNGDTAVPRYEQAFPTSGFDFDRVYAPAVLDLARWSPTGPRGEQAKATVVAAADQLRDLQRNQPWGQPYAPSDGWAWGSNGRLLNNLWVLAAAHQLVGAQTYLDALAEGMDYLFGRNALGQCYVTGFGTDRTEHLRTRQFGHDLDPTLPRPPRGALAGGANSRPAPGFDDDLRLRGLAPQQCYLDEPTSETTNDICIRWNAALVAVAGYLADQSAH